MMRPVLGVVRLLAMASPAHAQFDRVLKGLGGLPGGGSGLSDARIGAGLQEALKVGTENGVVQTGAPDGFLMNKAIKILMPRPLQSIEQPLRLLGYGPQIDEFVVRMNRAAEKAVPFAKKFLGRHRADDLR